MDLTSALITGKNIDISLKQKDGKPDILKTRIESPYNNGQFSVLSPIKNGEYYDFPDNKDFSIIFDEKIEKSPKIYQMNVRIVDKKTQKNQVILILQKTSNPSKIERRQTYRLQITKTFSYKYEGSNYDLLLKDISITGMRAIIEKHIPIKELIDVSLDLEIKSSDDILTLKAEVVSCDKLSDSIRKHDLRLKFVDVTPKDIDKISKYIVSEQSKILHNIHENKIESKDTSNIVNRRNGDDGLTKAIPVLGLLSWILSLVTIVFFLQARPEQKYNLDYFFNFQTRKFWDEDLLNAAMISAQFQFVFCAFGLILNSRRHKRKEDRYHKGLILNLIIASIILIISFLII